MVVDDDEGCDLPDLAAAIDHARVNARALAAESVKHGALDLSHFIDVLHSDHRPVARITFGEVVRISG